jgi:hypothetical protein
MPKRETEELARCHMWLFADDIVWLKARCEHSIGVSEAVRTLVRAYRQRVEAKVHDALDEEPATEPLPNSIDELQL